MLYTFEVCKIRANVDAVSRLLPSNIFTSFKLRVLSVFVIKRKRTRELLSAIHTYASIGSKIAVIGHRGRCVQAVTPQKIGWIFSFTCLFFLHKKEITLHGKQIFSARTDKIRVEHFILCYFTGTRLLKVIII